MKVKVANIDSLNISTNSFEKLFLSDNFIIQTAKSQGIFEPKLWFGEFGQLLQRHVVEAKIVFTVTGITLPLKRFSANPSSQTLEFAGLHSYKSKSEYLHKVLKSLYSEIQHSYIKRIDIAIDFRKSIPQSVINALNKARKKFKYFDSSYFKTSGEKKSNPKINILIYDKGKKEKLDFELWRLECSFRGNYFNKLTLREIEIAYKKMIKSIKRFTGLDITINPLYA